MTRVVALITAVAGHVGWAQSAPGFEVASVRAIKSDACEIHANPSTPRAIGNRFSVNRTLLGLILDAYNVREDQVKGLPGWADCHDFYAVSAKTPGEEMPATDQVRRMIQRLLADRFQLKLHHETRKLSVYELTVGNSEPKLHLFPDRTAEHRNAWFSILTVIQPYLDYPLIDKTGLSGYFDTNYRPAFDYARLREEQSAVSSPGTPTPGVRPRILAPSILHEVETELGLTLKKVTAPSDFLVIEHVERPSDN